MKSAKSILLIEDDKGVQEFFIQALREIENTKLYFVANNGKEAIDQLNDSLTLPDLIFTDISMPVMNGIECLTEIKKNPATKNIPVIIFSASTARAEEAFRGGAKAFIKKTVGYKRLREQIEEMVNLDAVADLQIPMHSFQAERPVYFN